VRSYPAKLLLFGEHTVLVGSSSLAMPLPQYEMLWVQKSDEHPKWLEDYTKYLLEDCGDLIDGPHLRKWLEGYTIQSNIPIGYGLGSSGALTAAIYDICGSDTDHDNYDLHQTRMAKMESFFHGKSSGFDPLVSYVNSPILKTKEGISISEAEVSLDIQAALVDSGQPRAGRTLIQRFLEAYERDQGAYTKLIDLNSTLSNQLFEGNAPNMMETIKQISRIQHEKMDFLITPEIKKLWEEGLSTQQYSIKICGAGGGGYFLCFKNPEGQWPEDCDLTILDF